MSNFDSATTKVAQYDVLYTQFLDQNGEKKSDFPEFGNNRDEMRAMYETMVRTRLFDKKAVALQRTGQLGTYAACLGQEAIGTAFGHFKHRRESIVYWR